jgi:hypothetical protein
MYKLYWSRSSGAMTPQTLFEEIGVESQAVAGLVQSRPAIARSWREHPEN